MASIKVGQAPPSSVLMLSLKSLKVVKLSRAALSLRGALRVMGKREEPHSDQDERDRDRLREGGGHTVP